MWEVAKDVDAVVEHNSRKPRPALQRSILQSIRQRRRAFTRCIKTQGGDVQEAMAIYIKMRKRVRIVIRRNRRRAEQRNIEKAVRNFQIVAAARFGNGPKVSEKTPPNWRRRVSTLYVTQERGIYVRTRPRSMNVG